MQSITASLTHCLFCRSVGWSVSTIGRLARCNPAKRILWPFLARFSSQPIKDYGGARTWLKMAFKSFLKLISMKITKKKLEAIDDQIKAYLLSVLYCIEFCEGFGRDRHDSGIDNDIIVALSKRAELLVNQLASTPFFKNVGDGITTGDVVFEKSKAIIIGQRIEGIFESSVGKGGCVTIAATNVNGEPTEITKTSCDHACGPSDFYEGGMCDKMGCYPKEAQRAYDAAIKRLDEAITHAKKVAELHRKAGRGGQIGYGHIQMRIERARDILQTSADLIELDSMAGELEGLEKID